LKNDPGSGIQDELISEDELDAQLLEDFDKDSEDEDDIDGDDDIGATKFSNKGNKSAFADADEFENILQDFGVDNTNKKKKKNGKTNLLLL